MKPTEILQAISLDKNRGGIFTNGIDNVLLMPLMLNR